MSAKCSAMYDFNVKWKPSKQKDNIDMIKNMSKMGWSTIAWNTNAFGKIGVKNQKQSCHVPLEPMDIKECLRLRSLVCNDRATQIEQLNRITVTVDEVVDAQNLTAGNEHLKSYDIVAACPGNAAVFAYLCKTAQVDLISIDFTRRVPFPMIKKQVCRQSEYQLLLYVLLTLLLYNLTHSWIKLLQGAYSLKLYTLLSY